MRNDCKAGMTTGAALDAGASQKLGVTVEQLYHVECWRDGRLVWEDDFLNLVVTAGLNEYLTATLAAGTQHTTWYVALITGPGAGNTYAATDTHASHPGFSENTGYSDATRQAWTPGAVSGGSVDNGAARAVFHVNGTSTVAGAFMSTSNVKGSTALGPVLLGEGNFSGGDRGVQAGDTLNVTVTCTMAAA